MKKKFIIILVILFLSLFLSFKHYYEIMESYNPDIIAIWVPRFDYQNYDDVYSIIKNCSDAGFTDILFQVRGNGTTFYNSSLEPWAEKLFNKNNNDGNPGWDPLLEAIKIGKKYNISIHAYINVLPGWKGTDEFKYNNNQLWTKNKDWFMVDVLGNTMLPTDGWYTFLNPAHPKVKHHIKGIVEEILEYDVDGLHLDYIRYPYDYFLVANQIYTNSSREKLRMVSNFSYDNISKLILKSNYGDDWTENDVIDFRISMITDLVGEISKKIKSRPNIILSASILANPLDARLYAGQDAPNWIHEKFMDYIFQMNYKSENFNENMKILSHEMGNNFFNNQAIVGIYPTDKKNEMIKKFKYIKRYRPKGIAVFSYGVLYDNHVLGKKGKVVTSLIKKLSINQ